MEIISRTETVETVQVKKRKWRERRKGRRREEEKGGNSRQMRNGGERGRGKH